MTSMAGNILGTVAKTTATMVTAATGAVAALTKVSVAQYAEYEQLVGGVETLFKDSSDIVKNMLMMPINLLDYQQMNI